ncbi:YkvA family protein [Aneurinibacillus migulanus]|uniref:YkvA family protein n=1 Tax=Aneurinibacillus migulanus TaxID=47500 RepID=UPI0006A24CBC|nr:YkvA family protein [Aneurinibacillus migulanus]MCP1354412.1 YkvA family protein [Aneurinibacillus migulanus]CEH29789.1 Uncharacterized protein BN1090_A2_02228 [Aneurinibacillus migulanus]
MIRMRVNEHIINAAVLPRLNQLLPNDIYLNTIRLYEGYVVAKAQVKMRGEWLPVLYTLQLDTFRFDASGRYITLIYTEEVQKEKVSLAQRLLHETEIFLTKNFTGKTLLMEVLAGQQDIHVSDTRITVQLAPLASVYPVLQSITVDSLTIEREALCLEVSGPPELQIESLEFDWMEPMSEMEAPPFEKETHSYMDGELVVLEREHKRYYDQLREKMEKYMREKMGDQRAEKAAPYLLLAPDLFVLLARLAKDKRIPLRSKSIALAAVLYFMTPLDIIPEVFMGPVGYADDIIFATLALNKMLVDVDEKIINEHWNGDKNIIAVIRDVLSKADSLVGKRSFEMIKKVFKNRK